MDKSMTKNRHFCYFVRNNKSEYFDILHFCEIDLGTQHTKNLNKEYLALLEH